MDSRLELDALIFGGGAAGLWLLDELTRRGCSAVLLEAGRLGAGQTIASQGILHGGTKYSLQGLLTASAAGVREMPEVWRTCLAGRRMPDLTNTRIRSEYCYLWQTETLGSRAGMWAAKLALQVAPQPLKSSELPAILADCPGTVARLDEQVISPASLLLDMSQRHIERIWKIDPANGIEIDYTEAGRVQSMRLKSRDESQPLELRPRSVVLTAGGGNAELRRRCGLTSPVMQRRPLHMVLVRGKLPELNGHCIDGAKTRVTITSDVDAAGRTVWQVGGQVSEDGVKLEAEALCARAAKELQAVIPGLDLTGTEWSTYRVDRAERATRGGKRPHTIQIVEEGNVLTAWPTKLVLVPQLAEELAQRIEPRVPPFEMADWSRPTVADPPWDVERDWFHLPNSSTRAA